MNEISCDLLPFSRALPLESALEYILSDSRSKGIYNYIIEDNKKIFENIYSRYLRSLTLLNKRFNFFMKVLAEDEDILEKYGLQMRSTNLDKRIVPALVSCYNQGNGLVEELNKTIDDYLVSLSNGQANKLSSNKRIIKIRRDIRNGKISEEEGKGSIDLERALVNPEMKAIINWTLGSDCERTGVCVCKGAVPPYMESCIDEEAILRSVPKNYKIGSF